LRETASLRDVVVGCGGGTAAFHGNMDWMKAHGLTVFLNTSFDILVRRIAETDSQRPLFQGCNKQEIMEKLSEIAEKRSIYYGSAKIIWNKSEPTDFLYRAVNQLVAIS
jgi:shikimate kinase